MVARFSTRRYRVLTVLMRALCVYYGCKADDEKSIVGTNCGAAGSRCFTRRLHANHRTFFARAAVGRDHVVHHVGLVSALDEVVGWPRNARGIAARRAHARADRATAHVWAGRIVAQSDALYERLKEQMQTGMPSLPVWITAIALRRLEIGKLVAGARRRRSGSSATS